MHFLLRNSFLLLISFLIFSFTIENEECFLKNKPNFELVKYRTSIDVIGKHLSGILIIKQQEDSSNRVIFINEMGITFFDYSFYENSYKVNNIMQSMNKKAVKKTLAKDLGMIIQKGIFKNSPIFSTINSENIATLKLQKKGFVKYFFDKECNPINQIENWGKRKKVVTINQFYSSKKSTPDSIFVQHHTVNFTISLKQINVTE